MKINYRYIMDLSEMQLRTFWLLCNHEKLWDYQNKLSRVADERYPSDGWVMLGDIHDNAPWRNQAVDHELKVLLKHPHLIPKEYQNDPRKKERRIKFLESKQHKYLNSKSVKYLTHPLIEKRCVAGRTKAKPLVYYVGEKRRKTSAYRLKRDEASWKKIYTFLVANTRYPDFLGDYGLSLHHFLHQHQSDFVETVLKHFKKKKMDPGMRLFVQEYLIQEQLDWWLMYLMNPNKFTAALANAFSSERDDTTFVQAINKLARTEPKDATNINFSGMITMGRLNRRIHERYYGRKKGGRRWPASNLDWPGSMPLPEGGYFQSNSHNTTLTCNSKVELILNIPQTREVYDVSNTTYGNI